MEKGGCLSQAMAGPLVSQGFFSFYQRVQTTTKMTLLCTVYNIVRVYKCKLTYLFNGNLLADILSVLVFPPIPDVSEPWYFDSLL